MTDKPTQSGIEKLVRDPKWSFVEKIALEMKQDRKAESISEDNQWELVKSALKNKYESRGITKFLQRLNEIANQNIQK